jgi:hypothetical protein
VNWTEVFAADVRSLAVLRVVLALTVLFDLITRATNLQVHYSDAGLLPRRVLVDQIDSWQVSLALMSGTAFVQALLFGIAAVAALGMLVGYRTTLMTIVVWVLMLSIQVRNPFVGSSGDDLLRLVLFWSMFLPLGAYWSVDRLRATVPQPSSMRVLSMATAGIFLQIAFVYWFTVLLKTGPEWRADGSALYYSLNIGEMTTPLGAYLLQFPMLLKVLTYGTLGIEVGATILLFCPVFTGPVRTAAVLSVMSLHLGIWLTMSIGTFPWISASCMVCFLPSWFWDTLVPWLRTAFPKLSSTAVATRQMAARVTQGFEATLWPRLISFGSAGQFSIPVAPASMAGGRADSAIPYSARAGVGQTTPDAHVETRMKWSSRLLNFVAAFFLVYVFVWNVAGVSAVTMTQDARALGNFLGLSQYWTMFAPYPFKATSWYVIPGTLRDGRQIDLLPAVLYDDPHLLAEVNWERPQDVRDNLNREERWRKYFEVLSGGYYPDLLLPFGQYICRTWNNVNHGSSTQLETFDIVLNWQLTLEDNQRGPPGKTVLWTHDCYFDT